MTENQMQLGVEILNLTKKQTKEIKKKLGESGVRLKSVGERLILYPVANVNDAMDDELGALIDPDATRFKIVYFNDDKIIESFLPNQVEGLDLDENSSFDAEDARLVFNFINENPDTVELDRSTIIGDDSNSHNDAPVENSDDDLKEEKSGDDFDDFDDEDLDGSAGQDNQNQSNDEDDKDIDDKNLDDDSDLDKLFDDVLDDEDSFEDSEPKDTPDSANQDDEHKSEVVGKQKPQFEKDDSQDPLMLAAIKIFERNTVGETLPVFDSKTKELISQGIVEAGNHLTDARKDAINRIYAVLKDTKDKEYSAALEGAIADAKKAHDRNVDQLKANQVVSLNKVSDQERSEYERRKKDAGTAVLNEFYAKYDQEHLDDLNKSIESQSAVVRNNTKRDIETEDDSLDKYINQVKDSVFAHVVNHAEVAEIINHYRTAVSDEKERLIAEAKQAVEENNLLKKKIQDLKSAQEIERQTAESRIKAEVAQKVNLQTKQYLDQVEAETNKRKNAERQSEQEISKKQKLIDSQQKKIEDQQAQLSKMASQMADVSKKLANAEIDKKYTKSISTKHEDESKNVHEQKKNSFASKILTGLGIAVVACGIGVGGTYLDQSHVKETHPTTTQSSTPKESSSSDTKTFIYTTKDGKKYAVIKDDSTSGHYIDDKGNTHTVIFK